MAVWQDGSMAVWQDGSMAVWQDGSMAVWQYGSMAGWQDGSMAVWLYGSMLSANSAYFPQHLSKIRFVLQHQCVCRKTGSAFLYRHIIHMNFKVQGHRQHVLVDVQNAVSFVRLSFV
jgi:hypothetical protein